MDLSLIIPAYNEKENIQILLNSVYSEFKKYKLKGEVIVVDDNSPDKTGEIVESLKKEYPSLQIIHRTGKLGLSSAVLEGFKIAKSDILGVMDADLSHPVKKIISLYQEIKNGADLAIGSRYIKGGKIDGWGLRRKLMSKFATFLSLPFTRVKDPMTGFFLVKKECIINKNINPKGFKILLEIILKGNCKNIKEVPITFTNRIRGKSKAGFSEIFYYLKNLLGYWKYRRKIIDEFFKFGIVGTLGAIINLGVLYALTDFAGIYYILSAVFAFIIAVTSNFFLNKIWTFREKVKDKTARKYAQFFSVAVFALAVNLSILYSLTEFIGLWYMFSELIAKVIVFFINFAGNKFWTFRKNKFSN